MNPLIQKLQSLIGPRAGVIAALGAPIAVLLVLSMMVLPLPPFVLDLLFTFNIAMAVMVMMVAAHADDLRAARACGLRTAFVERPLEEGPDVPYQSPPEVPGELRAHDLLDLARQLGC